MTITTEPSKSVFTIQTGTDIPNLIDKRILLLDTSNHWILTGLAHCTSTGVFHLTQKKEAADRDSFKKIMPSLREILHTDKITKPDYIVCVNGPGSFTGIRVGVSVARNLSQLWDIPVFGINSLLFYGYSIFLNKPETSELSLSSEFCVAVDGKQSKFYNSVFTSGDQNAEESLVSFAQNFTGASDSSADDIVSALSPDSILYSDTPDAFSDYNFFKEKDNLRLLAEPDTADLLRLALSLGFTEKSGSFESLIPDYMRPDPATSKFPNGIIK